MKQLKPCAKQFSWIMCTMLKPKHAYIFVKKENKDKKLLLFHLINR